MVKDKKIKGSESIFGVDDEKELFLAARVYTLCRAAIWSLSAINLCIANYIPKELFAEIKSLSAKLNAYAFVAHERWEYLNKEKEKSE